ncbi:MAG: ATP-binding protein [Myxococcales bacterium]|nr:ATP-binding protein [Myxococcales bacterium]
MFITLDRWIFPEHFLEFFFFRVAVNCVVVLVLVRGRFFAPRSCEYCVCAAVGAEVLAMVWVTSPPTSPYYAGLIVLFVGMPVLQPLRAVDALVICGMCCVGFGAATIWRGAAGDERMLWIHGVFLFSGAVESVVSCSVLSRNRLRDYSRRLELERARDELRELDVAKSRFTANIHHELRTPLTLTLAPVEALLSGEFGPLLELQRDYLRTIRTNGLRLLKLINNLLDLSKIEGGQMAVKRRPMRIGATVREMVEGARPLAERKGVELRVESLDGLPEINADPEAVEKILVNLLGNALKFTRAGGHIAVSGEATSEGGVHLVVADSGVGIPPDELERIFDRFAQVDGSNTRAYEGTGIGLALVRELTGLHGGEVWAESEGRDRGSRMHVVLPAGERDTEGEGALAEPMLAGPDGSVVAVGNSMAAMEAELDFDDSEEVGRRSGELRLAEMEQSVERAEGAVAPAQFGAFMPDGQVPRDAPEVLVVEDNADMRRLLSFLVGREYRLRIARNGREALQEVRERKPDLVLTDVMMPEMSGTELCAALKRDAETAGIPVVLVTSKAEREMKIQGLELGADDYVTKPFHPRELMARIRSLVRLRRLQEELAERNELVERTNEELRETLAELKEASAQLVHAERLSVLGELAAGVAHEVNNPVNFALNAVKALQECVSEVGEVAAKMAEVDTCDPEEFGRRIRELQLMRDRLQFEERANTMMELAGIVGEGLERTSRLVGDLRDFAAPDDRPRADLDVARGLRSTVQLVRHSLASAGIELRVEIPPDLPHVAGEARALNQVFLNLIKNAAESFAGERGSIDVSARAENGAVVVEVRDDGPGIPPELKDRIFEPFFTTKSAQRGTGLGLSICHRIVMQHGGDIQVESGPDRGAIMRVRLPIRRVETSESTHAS